MAATVANTHILLRGSRTFIYGEITLDSSYATNGESITADLFGMKAILGIWPSGADGYTIDPVKSTDSTWLIKVYGASTNTNTVAGEMVSGKDLSSVTIPVLVVGR